MVFNLIDILPALPELLLAALALVLVLVAAFGGEGARNTRRVTRISLGGILLALTLIWFGALLTSLSLLILNFTTWSGILIIGMFLMTVGEMIAFPFANAFALQQAKKGNQGEYIALYSIAFSLEENFRITSSKVSDEVSQPIRGLIEGSFVLNSRTHFLSFPLPD